jgi:luciferase family oxidoreductase group 1
MPEVPTAPEVWLLGSSDYSGLLSAQLGLRFAFAHFINAHGGEGVMRAYRDRFQVSAREKAPHTITCVFVICAESDAEAEKLARAIDLRRLHMAQGIDSPVPTLAEAEKHRFTPQEQAYVDSQRPRAVIGGPQKCRDELTALAERYTADELMVLTITGDYASRLASYEMLAEAFGLGNTG